MTARQTAEGVRKRPGMYLGPMDERGLRACIEELLYDAVEEYFKGFCTRIDVILHADGSCSVADNGRGIPVEFDPRFNVSASPRPLPRQEKPEREPG